MRCLYYEIKSTAIGGQCFIRTNSYKNVIDIAETAFAEDKPDYALCSKAIRVSQKEAAAINRRLQEIMPGYKWGVGRHCICREVVWSKGDHTLCSLKAGDRFSEDYDFGMDPFLSFQRPTDLLFMEF